MQAKRGLFAANGAKKVITASPHCLRSYKNDCAKLGAELEIFHYTVVVLRLAARGKIGLSSKPGKKPAFHHPCYLGRHSGNYDAARESLTSIPGSPPHFMSLLRNMITEAFSSLENQDCVEIKELFRVAGGESVSYNSNSGSVD